MFASPTTSSQPHGTSSPAPAFLPHFRWRSRTHLAKFSQSSPVVGTSFCLIIVRLGQILPEARDETWRTSIRTPALRTRGSDLVSVSFPQVEIRRDVYMSESKDFPMETLEPRKQEYADSSDDSPKVSQPSLFLSPPM